ncbi:MAG: AAA family ATPase [Polyangiales bacterium]
MRGAVTLALAARRDLVQIRAMIYAFADLELDVERNELRRAGKLVKADATVVRLLAALMSKAPRLVTKDELIELVWDGRTVAENVVTVAIARLRKLLNHRRQKREFITTSYGRGYRFAFPFEQRETSEHIPLDLDVASDTGLNLVGRGRKLASLRAALVRAGTGRGRLCTLMGEPGIGKTYLVEALEQGLSHGQAGVAWGFCRESGDTPPLGPWLRILREVKSTAQRLGGRWLGDPVVADLDGMLQAMAMRELEGGPLLDVIDHIAVQGPWRHRLFEAIASFLSLASKQMPWLLVLEDLHRADEASLELLHHLLDEIMRKRILIVATLRTPEAQGAPARLPLVLGHRNCERIVLERLRPIDVATYVSEQLDDIDGELSRAIFEKSEGNPFFMAELTRQQLGSGPVAPEAMTLPPVALDLARQHLARLEPQTRSVLSAAAVIGRSFELSLLRTLTDLDASTLMACVDEAVALEVVIAAPDSKTGFAFGHELLRSVLYDALSAPERRRWHLRVAEALEARSFAGEAAPPSELAHHFHSALPDTDLRQTVRYCRNAAARAALASANAEVVRYARHALEALELLEKPSRRLRMHLLYVISMFARNDSIAEFSRATSELIALACETDDGRMMVSCAALLNLHPGFKPVAGAPALMRRALGLLDANQENLRAYALAGLATSAPACFTPESHTLIAEAVDIARKTGSRMARYVSLLGELYLYGGPNDAGRAVTLADELDLLSQENPALMPLLPIDLAFFRVFRALAVGDLAELNVAIGRAAARAREVQHSDLLWHAARFGALMRVNTGELARGVEELSILHAQAEQRGYFGCDACVAFDRVMVLGEHGGVVELTDALRAALAYDASDPPSLWSLKLRALATAGLHSEARATLRALGPAAALRGLPADTHYLGTLAHVGLSALRLGALEHAEVAFALLEPHAGAYTTHLSFFCDGAVPHVLGTLAGGLGRITRAIALLEAGIVKNDRAGLVPRAIEGRLLLARRLSERGEGDDAKRAQLLRRQARASAMRVGLRRMLRENAPRPEQPAASGVEAH